MNLPSPETDAPVNPFKAGLRQDRCQIGFWQSLTSTETVAISARAGFDWILLDAEHAPNSMADLRSQIRAAAGGTAHVVVRPVVGADWMIKQILDLGAQTVLVPMVETAEQARDLVSACRYPPEGHRGVASSIVAASDFGARSGYLHSANAQIALIVQIESQRGLANLDAILAVDGIDGVFIGPADLSASLGHLGQPQHPQVQAAIADATSRIIAAGKAAGILLSDPDQIAAAMASGMRFVAVGSDVALFAQATRALATRWRQTSATPA